MLKPRPLPVVPTGVDWPGADGALAALTEADPVRADRVVLRNLIVAIVFSGAALVTLGYSVAGSLHRSEARLDLRATTTTIQQATIERPVLQSTKAEAPSNPSRLRAPSANEEGRKAQPKPLDPPSLEPTKEPTAPPVVATPPMMALPEPTPAPTVEASPKSAEEPRPAEPAHDEESASAGEPAR